MQHEQMQQHPCFIGSDKECSKMKRTKTKKKGNTWNCKEKEDKGEENVRIHRKI